MPAHRVYAGTTPTITDVIRDVDGNPIDLTDTTIVLETRPDNAAGPIAGFSAVYNPDQVNNRGVVRIQLGSPFMDTPAKYAAWWRVVFPPGTTSYETPANALVVTSHAPVAIPDPAGPCVAWITADDIATQPDAAPDIDYSRWADLATELLYQWSGRQFPGDCIRSVRPSRTGCSHWGGLVPTWLSWDLWGATWQSGGVALPDGCGYLSRIPLPGYVRSIESVILNGMAVDPLWYRVDWNRELVALFDGNGNPFYWPTCQDMRLGATDPGAFVVNYHWGHALPLAGKTAAIALALQLYKADHGGNCVLPDAVTRLTRQGVTLERERTPDKTGLASVDAFIAAYNPNRRTRQAAVWSPDLPRNPRRTA